MSCVPHELLLREAEKQLTLCLPCWTPQTLLILRGCAELVQPECAVRLLHIQHCRKRSVAWLHRYALQSCRNRKDSKYLLLSHKTGRVPCLWWPLSHLDWRKFQWQSFLDHTRVVAGERVVCGETQLCWSPRKIRVCRQRFLVFLTKDVADHVAKNTADWSKQTGASAP